MKTHLLRMILIIACISIAACSDDNDDPNKGGDENGGNGNGENNKEQILFGSDSTQIGNGDQDFYITESHTLKKGTYVLKGWVYIEDGASLTIEPGTVIKGDKDTKAALIVQRGGKLYAKGTASQPIIFTSNQPKGQRKPGDWGGIIVCGRAKCNAGERIIEGGPDAMHGGNDDNDNSGVLSYIRCEFAGYPFRTDEEINGITFGSVGRGTQVDHLQVSYCNDDSFEWFGGCVNAKYLISYHSWDDDFDTDNGYSGNLQFLLAVRHPRIADVSLSNGFESDNDSNGSTSELYTTPVFSNVTIVGPIGQDAAFENNSQYIDGAEYNPNNGSRLGIFQAAMQIRRNSRLNCFNSVAMGFPVGLLLDNQRGTTHTWAEEGYLQLQNLYFAEMGVLGADINNQADGWTDQLSTDGNEITDPNQRSFSSTFFLQSRNNNTYFTSINELGLSQPNSMLANANWGPTSNSPLVGKSDLFTHSLLQSNFFDKVDCIGAFASESDNWMAGWTNFDPQNTDY
ncbi:MAG: hypothetical protein LIO65_03670 [Odoribacter sp.]|nr:hypothetical protein [Odoribacter sp.]